jgi:3-oxoacyl-[acyl-carrier-protein] synthase-3
MAANNKRQVNRIVMPYAHIVGWGMSVPENVMTNHDLEALVETNDEWIRTRTGIRERRIAGENESTATLGYKAAQKALETADILPVDLDMIIVATSTPEHVFPSTASLIQDWLGASRAGAFDLSAACSGFVYALNMAAQSIRSGSIKTALVIGSETMSRVLDWQDRSTCILFGDGAGAVILQASEEPGGVLSSVLRSDGAGCDLLAIPTNNVRDLNGHKLQKMYMVGSEVFKFATRVVDESIREAAELADIDVRDIKLVVPHQANMRILQSASRKLRIDLDKWVANVDRYGNTSAASIPIALCEAIEDGRVQEDDYLALIGFGGGLTWASAIIQWGRPRDEQKISRINQQRRQLSYWLAGWRSRINRWRRSINRALRFLVPLRRPSRLQRKLEDRDLK